MIHPTPADIGRRVKYRIVHTGTQSKPLEGVLIAIREGEVLVRYTVGGPGIAAAREDLDWVDMP